MADGGAGGDIVIGAVYLRCLEGEIGSGGTLCCCSCMDALSCHIAAHKHLCEPHRSLSPYHRSIAPSRAELQLRTCLASCEVVRGGVRRLEGRKSSRRVDDCGVREPGVREEASPSMDVCTLGGSSMHSRGDVTGSPCATSQHHAPACERAGAPPHVLEGVG